MTRHFLGVCFIFWLGNLHATEWKIEGVSGEIKQNIQLHLNDLALTPSALARPTAAQTIKLAVNKAVQAYAYYNADITIELPSADSQKGTIALQLNQVARYSTVQIDGQIPAELPPDITDLLDELRALHASPLHHDQYENFKSDLTVLASQYGYFDFQWISSQLAVDPQQNSVSLLWHIDFGARYKFGELNYLRDTRGADLVESLQTFVPDQAFDQALVDEFAQRIRQSNYYNDVLVRGNSEEADKLTHRVPIELILDAKPRDNYQFGVGVSSDTGPRLTANWQRPWVNTAGHGMKSSVYLSNPTQTVDFGYQIPMANPLNDFLQIQVGARRVSQNQTDSRTYAVGVKRQFGDQNEDSWDTIWGLKYEREDFIQGLDSAQSTNLLIPSLAFNRVRRNSDLFVTWGDRQQLSIEGTSTALWSDVDIAKVLARTKWLRTYDQHRIILRADLGAIWTNDFDLVPASMRFFAGGDQSIRGFGLDELATREINTETGELSLIGGRYLSVVSAEYAYHVKPKWRVAAFIDYGTASQTLAADMSLGTGLGAHWLSPVGTVRIYIARGISDIEKTWRVHFSIGPGI